MSECTVCEAHAKIISTKVHSISVRLGRVEEQLRLVLSEETFSNQNNQNVSITVSREYHDGIVNQLKSRLNDRMKIINQLQETINMLEEKLETSKAGLLIGCNL